jgi:hypothetical protein
MSAPIQGLEAEVARIAPNRSATRMAPQCPRVRREDSGSDFSLDDVYAFEAHLSSLYPMNQNVRPKIRQQLQLLRDQGILEFQGQGRYRLLRRDSGRLGIKTPAR